MTLFMATPGVSDSVSELFFVFGGIGTFEKDFSLGFVVGEPSLVFAFPTYAVRVYSISTDRAGGPNI
jgi:hypothetical protein